MITIKNYYIILVYIYYSKSLNQIMINFKISIQLNFLHYVYNTLNLSLPQYYISSILLDL